MDFVMSKCYSSCGPLSDSMLSPSRLVQKDSIHREDMMDGRKIQAKAQLSGRHARLFRGCALLYNELINLGEDGWTLHSPLLAFERRNHRQQPSERSHKAKDDLRKHSVPSTHILLPQITG
ncbi:hypothetical protein SRHO_G00238910 [Serrasalmus rhombeus]